MINDQYSNLRDFPLRRRSNVYSRVLDMKGGHLPFNTLPAFAFQKRTPFKSLRSVTFLCLVGLSPFPDSHPFLLTSLRLVLLSWGKLLVLQVPGDQRSRVSATRLAPGKEECSLKIAQPMVATSDSTLGIPEYLRSWVSATWLAPGKEMCSLNIAQQMAVTADSLLGTRRSEEQGFHHVTRIWQRGVQFKNCPTDGRGCR